MNTILQLLRNDPYGVALAVLLLVALSPEKKSASLTRGVIYIAAFLIAACIGIFGLADKPGVIGGGVIASVFMAQILHYQRRILKEMRGENAENDISVLLNIKKVYPKAPTWLELLVPFLFFGTLAWLSYKIVYSIFTMQ